MNYLELLKINKNWKLIKEKINNFEAKNKLYLPPIYKNFLVTYNTNTIDSEELLCYYSKKFDTNIQFYEGVFLNDEHIIIQNLFDVVHIKVNMEAAYPKEDFIWKEAVLAIGECNDQGYLLVGTGVDNLDNIYIEYAHTEPRIKKIADNIFDFFLNYKIEAMEAYLPKGKKLIDVYQNWGENFWSVR